MLVAATAWETGDHMMLLRCIHDSLDVAVFGSVLDLMDVSTLPFPMGQSINQSHVLPSDECGVGFIFVAFVSHLVSLDAGFRAAWMQTLENGQVCCFSSCTAPVVMSVCVNRA